MYSIKLLIRYLMVKGKLAFGEHGEAEDNTIQPGISQNIKKKLLDFLCHY